MDKDNIVTGLLWVWMIAVLTAYFYQFQDFVRPILQLLGLL
jgi:hypothetical protein